MKSSFIAWAVTIAAVFLVQIPASVPFVIISIREHPVAGQICMFIPPACSMLVLYLCVKYIHRERFAEIVTSRQKFDMRRFAFGTAVWFALSALFIYISMLLNPANTPVFTFRTEIFFPMLAIALILLPLQTSFEEIFFRGYLFKGIAALCNSRKAAVIFVAVIFAGMHMANVEVDKFGAGVMFPQYLALGLSLGITAFVDDGLEIPMGMHFANNLFCLCFVASDSSTFTETGAIFTLKDAECTHTDTVLILLLGILFLLLYKWKFKATFGKSIK